MTLRPAISLLIAVLISTGQIGAQMSLPLDPAVDPFSISRGSTFSASGGQVEAGVASSAKLTRIAEDIRAAEAVIAGNHIAGTKLRSGNLTKFALEGMMRSLDPHSNFYDSAEWTNLLDEQQSGYTGIGATIANFKSSDIDNTYVLATFPGSPAARAKLRFGDKILAINGEKLGGQDSETVRDKIRGTSGTSFRLTVERSDTKRSETIEIRRNRVPQPSIPDAYILRPGIGYIDLSEGFNYTTSDEFDAALKELKRNGMRSLLLDLRGNGGGIVDQAVSVAGKFLPAGTLILTQKGRSRIDNRVWKSTNNNPETMPLVLLVNESTASASEIVAGAFQDADRALIVGEKTFGKGLVQSVINLPGKAGMTLTTARYLTPSGRSIQRDYSKIDVYDYFNNTGAVAGIDKPYFEARTATDRKVFGGDGIKPDEFIRADDLTPVQAALIDPIFNFAREMLNDRVHGIDQSLTFPHQFGHRVASGEVPVSDTLIAAFNEFALQAYPRIQESVLRKERTFIKLRLRYFIAMASFGSVSANQVLVEDDAQVAKAVETLPRSAQLAALADRTRRRK